MSANVNRERLIKCFSELCSITSPSWQEEGIIKYIIKNLNASNVNYKKYKCGKSFNLLVKIIGNKSKTPILFSSHMDTVTPCDNIRPIITDTKISSDGSTILGSDDKAAIASFLETINCLSENNISHGPLEFLFSCAEEAGLCGIKGFDLNQLKAKYAFVFDSEGKIGKIMVKAPYHSVMRVEIKGRAAHAGIAPEKGISAIRVASEIISQMPHGRIDDETTVNVGTISGGKATNIVAEETFMMLEARSINKKSLKSVEAKIENTIRSVCKNRKATAHIEKNLEYSGYSIGSNDNILKILNTSMKKINITPSYEASCGGSDTNIINKAGIKAVNLSIGMRNVHTKKEYINIKDLVSGTKLILSIIENV